MPRPAFKNRDEALASLKQVSFVDEFHKLARDAEGNALEDAGGDGIWEHKTCYPEAFLHPDNDTGLVVSAEDGQGFGDYYGEYRGGDAWVHPCLEAWAHKHGYIIEWRDPGSITLFPN